MYVWICDCSRLSQNLLIWLLIKCILLFRLRLAKCKKRTIFRQRIKRKTCGIGLFYILLYQLYAYTSSVESSWTSVLSWRRISCGKYAHSLHFQNQFNKQSCVIVNLTGHTVTRYYFKKCRSNQKLLYSFIYIYTGWCQPGHIDLDNKTVSCV